jgi:hypothetical protein
MRLGFWQKLAIFSTTGAVGFSGLLWFLLHDVLSDEPSDITRLLLMVHGASSYALLVAIGSLLPFHVRSGWRRRRNLVTGLTATGAVAILGVTALVLYYGDEDMRAPARWLHLMVGLACFAVFPVHAFLGSRSPRPAQDAADNRAVEPAPYLERMH